jgi:4-hydroxy-3-methylbut-2-en-1-yl diphosphate reductase
MEVVIDSNSGFCFGVIKAIDAAEKHLSDDASPLYCLGEIVHNNEEVTRLEDEGLITINHQQIEDISAGRLLIRAHGEPPETYKLAKSKKLNVIDATCPVVLKLQQRIRKGYHEMITENGQILIFGKQGHAEVNGLVGQTENQAIVINAIDDIKKIDFTRPARLFSQTTQSVELFKELVDAIEAKYMEVSPAKTLFKAYDTICRQVANRAPQLKKFAKNHQVILFVSGKQSSNGKYLYQICKESNENTYFISSENEIKKEWFQGVEKVGVCGATSTPMWLMENVSNYVSSL